MPVSTHPKVSIIILNWNGLVDTLECLESVSRLTYPNCEIMVVDNCSTGGEVQVIGQQFPQVVLIENKVNLGFAGGNNAAIPRALEHGADYIWLLNNDTVVEPETLSTLVGEAERSPEIGLVTPVIRYYDSPHKIQSIGAYAVFENYELVDVKVPEELDEELVRRNLLLFGTALLIKKSVLCAIGGLSEKYFAYHEDYDYSLRSLRKKFKNKVILGASILHKDSRSTAKDSPIKVFLRTRNTYFLWRDNERRLRNLLFPGRYVAMMMSCARNFSDAGDQMRYDACVSGVWAALSGKAGAYDPSFVTPPLFKRVFRYFMTSHPYFWTNLFMCNLRAITVGYCKRIFK